MTREARPMPPADASPARRFVFDDLHGEIVATYHVEPLEAPLRALVDPGQAGETIHWGRNYLFRGSWAVDGGPAVDVVVKQFRNKGLKNRLRRWRGGSKAVRSWRMARLFEAAGVATAPAVALVESTDPTGPSFFVTRMLRGAVESRMLFRAMNAGRATEAFPDIDPNRFLDDLGAILRRMHDAGFFHRDLSIGNVLLVPPPEGSADAQPNLSIIDLNRCRVRRRIGLLARNRDLCRLTAHRPEHQRRLLTAYWGTPPSVLRRAVYWLMHHGFRAKIDGKKRVRGWGGRLKGLAPRTTHAHIPAAPAGAGARDKSVWDALSDQPHQHASRAEKLGVRLADAGSHLRNARTVVAAMPRITRCYRQLMRTLHQEPVDWPGVGVAVRPHPDDPEALLAAVRDLGVEQVLLRLEPWQDDHDDEERLARELAAAGYEVTFALPQDRSLVVDPVRWRSKITELAERFVPFGRRFQVGQAVNRSKWGIWRTSEYLELAASAAEVLRARDPSVRILGPAVIDFELHATAAIVNAPGSPVRFDALASLLYVDRRGAPENRQLGFDTIGKAALCRAVAETARHCGPASWITEVNWPLWEGPHSPAGRSVSVDEATQAHYLSRFYLLALASGMAERVFWWQAIATGYGLIDPREVELRRRPAFDALATLGAQLRGSRFLGADPSSEGSFIYRFRQSNGETLLAAWTVEGEREIEVAGDIEAAWDEGGQVIDRPRRHQATLGPAVQFLRLASA